VADGKGSWWPFAVPAVVAVVAISLTFALGGGGHTAAPLSCPKTLRTSSDRPRVPHVHNRVDTEGRLAPPRLPTRAIVCAYDGPGRGVQPARKPLTGSKVLRGRLDVLADTLAYAPGNTLPARRCPAEFRNEDDGYYLLGLTYTDGTEWIDATQNICSPISATNGSYDSATYLTATLRDAYQHGSWPQPKPRDSCGGRGAGRTGQEKTMVPDGVVSADLCKRTRTGIAAHRALDEATARRLAASLNSLPTKPGGSACFGWHSAANTDIRYEIVFHYPVGTDAAVIVQMDKDCTPISNGLLAADDRSGIERLVQQLLR
jgi:hypothetical protein